MIRRIQVLAISSLVFLATVSAHATLSFEASPHLTTTGGGGGISPAAAINAPGSGVNTGVAELLITKATGTFRCSGTLLSLGGRQWVLTAAHCLTDGAGNLNTASISVGFNTAVGSPTIAAASWKVHSGWNGDFLFGHDIALVQLAHAPPPSVADYALHTTSAVGATGFKVGYGRSGTGSSGDTIGSGDQRDGTNKYDDTHNTMMAALGRSADTDGVAAPSEYLPGAVLQYDFDNGLAANDAFGFFFGNADLGTGASEVAAAPGDSGGPTFVGGKIAGVTSYGITLSHSGGTSDVLAGLNSSFGEFGGDTSVAYYSGWIHANTPDSGASLILLLLGVIGLALLRRNTH